MASRPRVLIVGAGIAGPAVAYWLVRHGYQVTLVERTAELRTGGHAVDIRGTALEVVERMGLASAMKSRRYSAIPCVPYLSLPIGRQRSSSPAGAAASSIS
ncbi:FAD-dependent oxidoreductase [Mycolicibacterium wolinskyi]|uniref:FAD-dependent oxidoreductase n=1 Tax=Mycolicibacterium wolinskyi TaxID=59750 RepID=UPI0039179239